MIENHKILAIIPARGGSKGIPRKNLQEIAGKSLIEIAFESAKSSQYIDKVILSSDDPEIIVHAKDIGLEVPFTRPSEFATDESSGMDPVLHALEALNGFDIVVLLQVTSPLRTSIDIDKSIETMIGTQSHSCVSVTHVEKAPEIMFRRTDLGSLSPYIKDIKNTRRQDFEKLFVLNGAVYVGKVESVKKYRSFITDSTASYVMDSSRSLDIDTPSDLDYLRYLKSKK